MAKKDTLPTQEFIEIDSVYEDTLILKTGGLRKILLVSGVNIELKSEEEQNIIYFEYEKFLNSLDFSLQFLVHSRKLNIDGYLKLLDERSEVETDDLLKNEVTEYREFIRSFVAENDIMTKNFFVVVPFDSLVAAAAKGVAQMIPNPFSKNTDANNQKKESELENFKKNLFQLNQRVDHVINGLHAIGLRAVTLNKEEIVELFYNLYNPGSTERQDLNILEIAEGLAKDLKT